MTDHPTQPMTPRRLAEINARCEAMAEACKNCEGQPFHCAGCGNNDKDLPALTAEIARVQALVKTAYREGGQVGYGDDLFDEDNYCWDNSKARKALEE